MSADFLTKDPTRLACPRCDKPVDAGARWRSLRAIRRRALVCPHCAAPLRKESRSYLSNIVLMLTIFSVNWRLPDPWSWLVPLGGMLAVFFLVGKENQSTRLVLREPFKE